MWQPQRNSLLANPAGAARGHWLAFVGFYAIAANMPFWTASHFLHVEQTGWFCLEYACVGLLAIFVRRSISAVLLLFVIIADALLAVSLSYYISPRECLRFCLVFLRGIPGPRLLMVCVILVLALAVTAAAWWVSADGVRKTHRYQIALALSLFIVVTIGADMEKIWRETGSLPNPFRPGTSADTVRVSYYERPRLTRAPVAFMIRNELRFAAQGHVIHAARVDTTPIKSAVFEAQVSTDPGPRSQSEKPNVVLILVESWGRAVDTSLSNALTGPYNRTDLRARYRVAEGTVPFYGPTLSGEARELCASRMGFHLLEATKPELDGCVPHLLQNRGYDTLAVHGMSGNLFRRSDWYPTVGFDDAWFGDRLRQAGLPDCPGAFNGTCDHAIAEWIGNRLESKRETPEFVYWVTLNSHVPVPYPPLLAAPASCILNASPTLDRALCSWYQLVFNVHDSVYRLAMDKLARPTVFVVVGDHAPPFADPSLRNRFSSSVVPYVVLTPR